MDAEERRAAKARLVAGMRQGHSWQEAVSAAGLPLGRSAAYRLTQRVRVLGEEALHDQRHGHPSKRREPVQQWLEAYCRSAPGTPSRVVQAALQERFGLRVSLSHLNRVRARLGLGSRPDAGGKRTGRTEGPPGAPPSENGWQEGAGGLLLLAGAEATGLLSALEPALRLSRAAPGTRLQRASTPTRQRLLRTLLFLRVVGLRRPWDLRGDSGDGLALLTGRPQAYGYRTVARFLRELAVAGGAETLTDALGQWTSQLWQPARPRVAGTPPPYYIDGHRKAVYSDSLIPRGLVGRRGAVLGCRALVLLHDVAGHPLFVTTHRGDLHLTVGIPGFLARYEAHNPPLSGFVIDREGMAAEFLAQLTQAGRRVVTLLRRDQYTDLSSFSDVGPFVPWRSDRRGRLLQEVAAARYRLTRPDQPGEGLELSVALVRDLRSRHPLPPASAPEGERDLEAVLRQGQPLPPLAPPPRLRPIVVTAPVADPVALAAAYGRRWPAQENSFKDFLLPLGLDTNHGFGKTPVVNSEQAKRRAAVEQRRAALQRWTGGPAALDRRPCSAGPAARTNGPPRRCRPTRGR